jgi:hypothetical protein
MVRALHRREPGRPRRPAPHAERPGPAALGPRVRALAQPAGADAALRVRLRAGCERRDRRLERSGPSRTGPPSTARPRPTSPAWPWSPAWTRLLGRLRWPGGEFPGNPTPTRVFYPNIPLAVVPVGAMTTNPNDPRCQIPILPPAGSTAFYEAATVDCQEMPTGMYGMNVLQGDARGVFEENPVFITGQHLADRHPPQPGGQLRGPGVDHPQRAGHSRPGGGHRGVAERGRGLPGVRLRPQPTPARARAAAPSARWPSTRST